MGISFSIIAHQKTYEAGNMINEPENYRFTVILNKVSGSECGA